MVRYLFTTKTCPNCKVAKRILGNEAYTLVDAEENQEAGQPLRSKAGRPP